MEFYEKLIYQAADFLQKNGWLLLEIGAKQEKAVRDLMEAAGFYDSIEMRRDYAGLPRVIKAGEKLVDKIVIKGGKPIYGNVQISGAKNAALPVLASAIVTEGENTFHNIPDLMDIKTIKKLLKSMGVQIEGDETSKSMLKKLPGDAPYDLVKTMSASILVLGPLVARMGVARVSLPGGCAIGARPVNLHLKALQDMGAHVN